MLLGSCIESHHRPAVEWLHHWEHCLEAYCIATQVVLPPPYLADFINLWKSSVRFICLGHGALMCPDLLKTTTSALLLTLSLTPRALLSGISWGKGALYASEVCWIPPMCYCWLLPQELFMWHKLGSGCSLCIRGLLNTTNVLLLTLTPRALYVA